MCIIRKNAFCKQYLGVILLLALGLLLWISSASLPGFTIFGCFQDCASLPAVPSQELRLLSLNMLHGHPGFEDLPARLNLIAEKIIALDADVVLLQEVPWTAQYGNGARYLAERCDMNYAFLRANGNRWGILFEEGVAILSRYPLRELSFQELQPAAGFFEHRVVLHALASTPSGDLDLFVTHLTNKEEETNQLQADSLAGFVESRATHTAVVAGDFNAEEDSPQIIALSALWVDSYRSLHPDRPGLTCCVQDLHALNGLDEKKRIDYIFLVPKEGEDLKPADVQIMFDQPYRMRDGWQWASDHLGLFAVLAAGR